MSTLTTINDEQWAAIHKGLNECKPFLSFPTRYFLYFCQQCGLGGTLSEEQADQLKDVMKALEFLDLHRRRPLKFISMRQAAPRPLRSGYVSESPPKHGGWGNSVGDFK